MDASVAGLVLASAFLHPLWNALIKRDPDPGIAYLTMILGFVVLALAHALAKGVDLMAAIEAWTLVAASAACQFAYGLLVVRTMKRGDLSVYYPIIRSSPLGIVAIGVVALGETYSPALLAGIALALVGAFVLQHRPGARLLADPLALGLALGAMLGAAAHAVIDARLTRSIDPIAVVFWTQALAAPGFAMLCGRNHGDRRFGLPFTTWAASPLRYAALGVLGYGGYYLVLLAYELGGNVAAISAVRQISIPISVLIGGVWLAEAGLGRRLPAALVLGLGVIVVLFAR
ncbi:MAG: EamA family transporter [Pseudomonadota bacterium]